jgi:uncharacterized protein with PIN domain
MFVDASAIFAIIAQESDWRELSERLTRADQISYRPYRYGRRLLALPEKAGIRLKSPSSL